MHLYREVFRFGCKYEHAMQCVTYALSQRDDAPILYDSTVASAVVVLQDAWAVACRAIVLNSAEGEAFTRKGHRLLRSPILSRDKRPMDELRKKWRNDKEMPKSWEPNWHIPKDAIRAADLLQVVNCSTIVGGLGAAIHVDKLRCVRNVIAHSFPDTWKKLKALQRQMGYRTPLSPSDFVLSRGSHGTGLRLLDQWYQDMEYALNASVA